MPETIAVNAFLSGSSRAVVTVPSIEVYPNGLVTNLVIRTDPHEPIDVGEIWMRQRHLHHTLPRFGVRFADGREAGRSASGQPSGVARDSEGLPTQPVLRRRGGGGGMGSWHVAFWLYPLPPDGPLDVFVGLAEDEELTFTLDGAAIRTAAERATIIWS